MVGWLLVCVPTYYAARLLRLKIHVPRMFLAGIGRIAGARIATKGSPAPAPVALIANHVSWLDIPALARARGAAFIAHDGLSAHPVLRWLCEMNGTTFIARHDRAGVAGQVDQMRAALATHPVVTLFPEGTTSDGRGLLPFKSSLLSALDPAPAGTTIQPVLLNYGPGSAEVAWVGNEHGVHNFLKILGRAGRLPIVVHYLPPLQGSALASRKAMTAAAQAALGAALAS